MIFLLAAVVQTVTVQRLDVIDLTIPQPCERTKADQEVVVCAKRGESPYRLGELPPAKRLALPDAQVKIADGVSAGAETESVDVGGFSSNRLMLRFKMKF
jgi:hypothetical protein